MVLGGSANTSIGMLAVRQKLDHTLVDLAWVS